MRMTIEKEFEFFRSGYCNGTLSQQLLTAEKVTVEDGNFLDN